MNERQRQDYLEAMGIQPWFPRFVLPAAKPSYNCDWDFEQDPVPGMANTAEPAAAEAAYGQPAQQHPGLTSLADTVQPGAFQQSANQQQPYQQPSYQPPQPGDGTRDSSSILSDLGFAKEEEPDTNATNSKTTDTQSAASAGKEAEADEAPALAAPFRLAVIDVNESCIAITDLPWSGLNQFTSFHERLLRNITKSINLKADQEMNTGLFTWPLIPDAPPVDRKYAREAVLGFLNHQYGLQRRKTILLFGRTSCKYLWSHKDSFENCRGMQERNDSRYAITCSLSEMLSVPDLKAEAWANLKPLLAAPSSEEPSASLT